MEKCSADISRKLSIVVSCTELNSVRGICLYFLLCRKYMIAAVEPSAATLVRVAFRIFKSLQCQKEDHPMGGLLFGGVRGI